METAPPLLTLEEFLKTPIGLKVPRLTRLIASKLESGDAPEHIARALGISIEIVNQHVKVIQCFPCRPLDEKLMEEEQQEEDLEQFAAALHKAVATSESKTSSPSSAFVDEAWQRAKVLEYLDTAMSGKLSEDVRKQLRMWAEGASQREVGRKLGVDQGNLSRRIKAALQEAIAGEGKQINKVVLKGRPRSDDALAHASTGGKTHERWARDADDLPARKIGPAGTGPEW